MARSSMRAWLYRFTALSAVALIPGGCPSEQGGGVDVDGDGVVDGIVFDPTNKQPFAVLTISSGVASPGQTVTLDASASTDEDGDPLTFTYSQSAGPNVDLSAAGESTFSFVVPPVLENSEFVFEVTVRDGRGGSSSAPVSMYVVVSAEFGGSPQSVAKYRDNLTPDEAYHLLRRAAFGARPVDVSWAVDRGLEVTVDDLLTEDAVPATVDALAGQYEERAFHRWMVHLMESPNPLHERMAMFWHDRFATSSRVADFRDRNLGLYHRDMLRWWGLRNYQGFLESLTLDPLMLIWLDGANSPRTSPNENYAREFWELFTLGRDTLYSEQDIREASRAFTGITLLRQNNLDARPIFDLYNHDETMKTIFPERTSGPQNYNYQGVISLTLAQPEAARYVARNLFTFFVHDHPSDEVVEDLAKSFRESGWEIAPLVRRILLSHAMFSPEARGNQITSPVEHFVGVARTLDMHIYSEDSQGYTFDRLLSALADSGQELLNPPGVEGWKENEFWLQDQWIIRRVNALGVTMEYGPDRVSDLPYHLLPPVETWNQRAVRDQIIDAIARVFHLPVSKEERELYLLVLDQGGYRAFNLEDPRYQPQHVFELIRLMAMDERVIGR